MARTEWVLSALFLALVIFGTARVQVAEAIQNPCDACEKISAMNTLYLWQEKEKASLDFRRPDSEGKRVGKMVQFKFSELRAYDILQNTCVESRGFVMDKDGTWGNARANMQDAVDKYGLQEVQGMSEEMENYCYALLEKYEDQLVEQISRGTFDFWEKDGEEKEGPPELTFGEYLCWDLSKDCIHKERPSEINRKNLEDMRIMKEKRLKEEQEKASSKGKEGGAKKEL